MQRSTDASIMPRAAGAKTEWMNNVRIEIALTLTNINDLIELINYAWDLYETLLPAKLDKSEVDLVANMITKRAEQIYNEAANMDDAISFDDAIVIINDWLYSNDVQLGEGGINFHLLKMRFDRQLLHKMLMQTSNNRLTSIANVVTTVNRWLACKGNCIKTAYGNTVPVVIQKNSLMVRLVNKVKHG